MRLFKRKESKEDDNAYPDGAAEVLFERTNNSHPPPQRDSIKRGKGCNIRSRDGVPIITAEGSEYFSPSAVSGKNAVSCFYTKNDHKGSNRPRVRPSAKSSAFGGAPRYDWMDIVSFYVSSLKIKTMRTYDMIISMICGLAVLHCDCVPFTSIYFIAMFISNRRRLRKILVYIRKPPLPSKSNQFGVVS